MSLWDSVDHEHYRIAANAVAVTSTVHKTLAMREALDLYARPYLMQVVDHLLQTAAGCKDLLWSNPKHNPDVQLILEDLDQLYGTIVVTMDEILSHNTTHGQGYITATERLNHEPWVLVHGRQFVLPSQVSFDAAEDNNTGTCDTLPACTCLPDAAERHALLTHD